jgi:hypothetical protein
VTGSDVSHVTGSRVTGALSRSMFCACATGCAISALVGLFHRKWQSRQTGSRNLMDPKTLPTIWCTYMKLVTKYQISTINSCWEKCDEKCAYMFNVYKNKLSRQSGSRNLTGPKTLLTIWYTHMTLVTKYQISVVNSYWEKCDEKYLGRTEGRTDRWTEVKQYTPLPAGSGGIKEKMKYAETNCRRPYII